MRRLLISLFLVAACMVMLISLVMTLVPDTDTLTTRRYDSPNGFKFDYPRSWSRLDMSLDERELSQLYLASGYMLDCAFAPGLFSAKSMSVYVSQAGTTMDGMKYFTDSLIEAYESAGYDINVIGYSRLGAHLYYTVRLNAGGIDMREYMIVNGERMYSFMFTGCSDADVEGVLSSVSFFVDVVGEPA